MYWECQVHHQKSMWLGIRVGWEHSKSARNFTLEGDALSIHTDVMTDPAYPGRPVSFMLSCSGRPSFASGVESFPTQAPSCSRVWHGQTKNTISEMSESPFQGNLYSPIQEKKVNSNEIQRFGYRNLAVSEITARFRGSLVQTAAVLKWRNAFISHHARSDW